MKSSVKLFDKGKEKSIKKIVMNLEVDFMSLDLAELFETVEEIKEKCCERGSINDIKIKIET